MKNYEKRERREKGIEQEKKELKIADCRLSEGFCWLRTTGFWRITGSVNTGQLPAVVAWRIQTLKTSEILLRDIA